MKLIPLDPDAKHLALSNSAWAVSTGLGYSVQLSAPKDGEDSLELTDLKMTVLAE